MKNEKRKALLLLIIRYSLIKKGDFFCETAFLFDSAALNQ